MFRTNSIKDLEHLFPVDTQEKIHMLKYLLLVGANTDGQSSLPYNNYLAFTDSIHDIKRELAHNFDRVFTTIIDPKTTIPFFQALHADPKLKKVLDQIALQTLRATDPDLKNMRDQLLLTHLANVPYSTLFPMANSFEKNQENISKTATLAIREFRDQYPEQFSRAESKDKKRLLKEILEEKFNRQLSRAERFWLKMSMTQLASTEKYPTKVELKKSLNPNLERQAWADEIINQAIKQLETEEKSIKKGTEKISKISTLEKNALKEMLTTALIKNEWDCWYLESQSNAIAEKFAEFLKQKMIISTPATSPFFVQCARLVSITQEQIDEVVAKAVAEVALQGQWRNNSL